MGSGGVAIAALPTVICLKVPFSDGLGGGGIVLPGKGHHVKKDKDIRNSPLSNVLLISKLNKTNQNEWSKDIS